MASFTINDVLNALKTVEDPDLKKDLVTLGMIEDIVIDGDTLSFTVVLTTPACPLKEVIKRNCEEAIAKLIGGEIKTNINMSSRVTTTRTQAPLLPNVKNVVAIASGKGGVGKSTVTANLAAALAKSGARVGIIDADITGPSMHVMFNCEHEQPQMVTEGEKNWLIPVEQYGVKLMSIGLLMPADNALVWRGPMASSALRQFLADVKWGELDYLLIDLPPGTSDIHLTLVQTVPVTGAVIVTTPQKVAIADARKGLSMFQQDQIKVPVLGIVENMAYFTPEELPDNKYFIFGEGGGQKLAEHAKVPFLGQLPLVQGIRESGDNGYPYALKEDAVSAEAFENLAEAVAQQVAIRNAAVAATKVVEVN